MKIAIMGAGAYGTALGGILAEKGYDIDYYDPKIERENLGDVLLGAKMVILSVPSEAVSHILPYLPKNIPLIVTTKGILSDRTFENFKDYMILSGPGFADDIKAHKKTKLTATDDRIIKLFSTDYLSFDFTDDIRGVLMCGSLKNVYAILAGILGLQRDSEAWVDFVFEAADEMKRILACNGADEKTVNLVCGIGDLKLTCGYPSRNYEFGDLLRTNPNYKPKTTIEGASVIKKIKRGEIALPDNLPLLSDLISRSEKWA